MRILFCNHEYPPLGGGGGAFNALLAKELAKRHQVSVLTSRTNGLPAEERQDGVRIVRAPIFCPRDQMAAGLMPLAGYMIGATSLGLRHMAGNGYDVINTHFCLPAGPVGQRLARAARIPNVLTVHGGDLFDPSKKTSPHRHELLRRWNRSLLRHASAVVAQSTDTIRNVHWFYDSDLPVERIPLGIEPPPEAVGQRATYGVGADETLFVTVGRLVARKAVDRLIRIFANLDAPEARLLIIGTGPEEDPLRAQIASLGLAERVRLLGHVSTDEKFRLLRMADCFLSASQHEGFGLMFVEAMASGLPVIAYDQGGQVDFLSDGTTGHLVPLNDEARFLDAIRHLLRSKDLRQRIGRDNRVRARQFGIERSAMRYEALFEATRSSMAKAA